LKPRDVLIGLFLGLSSVIFAVTAVAKLVTIIQGESKLLTLPDPVFQMPTSWLMAGAAVIELILSLWLALFQSPTQLKLKVVGLVAVLLSIYKCGIFWLNAKPCSCLGALVKWSPWLEAHRNEVTWGLLIFLLLGSVLSQIAISGDSRRAVCAKILAP
jgi:hypothetical protein